MGKLQAHLKAERSAECSAFLLTPIAIRKLFTKASVIVCVFPLMLCACQPDPQTAEEIVDRAIQVAGGERYESVLLQFDFRDRSYSVSRDNGLFEMTRTTYYAPDSIVKDHVHNYGFKRTLNDSMISVSDSMAAKYKSSVNSVIYFFLLPFGLDAPAVIKKRLEDTFIKNQQYYKVKVTFREEGGGEDFEDEFVYWINQETFYVDYFAYSYHTDGGGMRFREAINPRTIGGIRIVDYINYKPITEHIQLERMEEAYLNDELEVLSRIENDNVIASSRAK